MAFIFKESGIFDSGLSQINTYRSSYSFLTNFSASMIKLGKPGKTSIDMFLRALDSDLLGKTEKNRKIRQGNEYFFTNFLTNFFCRIS